MTKQSFTLDQQAESERIAKRIARAGICSRREAEARILDGRVTVNGEVISSPALNVGARDKITIDGKPLPGVVNLPDYGAITNHAWSGGQ